MFAAVVGFSSCVKNEVSDEVKAIRQAQVTKLNADAAFMAAKVIGQNLENTAKEITNSYNTAMNAILIAQGEIATEEAQVVLETNLSALEVALAEAQADLLRAQIDQATQQDLYAEYLANGNFKTLSGAYFLAYTTAMGEMNTLYGTRLTIANSIAADELLLSSVKASGVDNKNYLLEKAIKDLADAETSLESKKSDLEAYQAILADPASIQSQLVAAENTADEMKAANLAIAVDTVPIWTAMGTANYNDYYTAKLDVKAGDALVSTLTKKTAALADSTAKVAKLKLKVDTIHALTNAAYNAKYPNILIPWNQYNAQAIVVKAAKVVADEKAAAGLTSTLAQNNLYNAYLNAIYLRDLAYVYSNGDLLNSTYTAANNVVTNAWNAYFTYVSTSYAAGTYDVYLQQLAILNGGLFQPGATHPDYDPMNPGAVWNYGTGLLGSANAADLGYTDITDLKTKIGDYNTAIATLKTAVADAQTAVDNDKDDYAEAKTDTLDLGKIVRPAISQLLPLRKEVAANTKLGNDASALVTALTALIDFTDADFVTSVNDRLDKLTTAIETLEETTIPNLKYLVAKAGIDIPAWETKIANQVRELDFVDAQIDQKLAMANYWKALLDALMTGK